MNVHQVTKLVLDCGGSCKQFSGKMKLFNGLRLNMHKCVTLHIHDYIKYSNMII